MQRDPPGPTLAPTGGGKQTIEPFGWQFAGHQLQPGRNRLNDRDIELGSAQVNENRFNTAAGEGIPQDGELIARAPRCRGPNATRWSQRVQQVAGLGVNLGRARDMPAVGCVERSLATLPHFAGRDRKSQLHLAHLQDSGSHRFFQREPRRQTTGQSAPICVD
ncbi:MAG: hypothetical protein WAO08_28970 [Hyphomicrobiaceae bacterium]